MLCGPYCVLVPSSSTQKPLTASSSLLGSRILCHFRPRLRDRRCYIIACYIAQRLFKLGNRPSSAGNVLASASSRSSLQSCAATGQGNTLHIRNTTARLGSARLFHRGKHPLVDHYTMPLPVCAQRFPRAGACRFPPSLSELGHMRLCQSLLFDPQLPSQNNATGPTSDRSSSTPLPSRHHSQLFCAVWFLHPGAAGPLFAA